MRDLPQRVLDKIDHAGRCWLWTGATTGLGYGSLWWQGKMRPAHRVVYELLVGPIPPGLELDHVRERGCTHRNCVNPAHLEPVTHAENVKRSVRSTATHCRWGHPFDESNTYRYPRRNERACRTCRSKVAK